MVNNKLNNNNGTISPRRRDDHQSRDSPALSVQLERLLSCGPWNDEWSGKLRLITDVQHGTMFFRKYVREQSLDWYHDSISYIPQLPITSNSERAPSGSHVFPFLGLAEVASVLKSVTDSKISWRTEHLIRACFYEHLVSFSFTKRQADLQSLMFTVLLSRETDDSLMDVLQICQHTKLRTPSHRR